MTHAEALALVQRSPDWFQACIGSVGASRVHDIISEGKAGTPSVGRKNLFAQIVVETLTGKSASSGYQSPAMQKGTEREPEGRREYVFLTGNEVQEVGMYLHPTIAGTHASPDGIIGDDGLFELKCPEPAEHIRILLGGKIAASYLSQAYWQMACSQRAWVDWVSYNPDFPAAMQMKIIRIPWDSEQIGKLENAVTAFVQEVRETVERLKLEFA